MTENLALRQVCMMRKYVRVPPHGTDLTSGLLNLENQQHPEDNWVWSPQGVVNMHIPDRWGKVSFVDDGAE